MKRSPLNLFKTKAYRAKKFARHQANIKRRAELHSRKAHETNPERANQIQLEIDAISLGPVQSLFN